MSDYDKPLIAGDNGGKKKMPPKQIGWTIATMVMTFLIYASYHMTRKIPSVVTNVIHPTDSTKGSTYGVPTTKNGHVCNNTGWQPFNDDMNPYIVAQPSHGITVSNSTKDINGQYNAADVTGFSTYTKKDGSSALAYCAFPVPSGKCSSFSGPFVGWTISSSTLCNVEDVLFLVNSTSPVPNSPGGDWVQCMAGEVNGPVLDATGVTIGTELWGDMITLYLGFYALGLFIAGHVADRMNLKLFVCLGMLGSAVTVALVGLSYYFNIDSSPYFWVVFAVQGLCQATGWPAVVAITGPWLGKGKRGLWMGIWNAHTSVGNIMGNVVGAAGLVVKSPGFDCNNNWPMAFILAACVMTGVNLITVFVLKSSPASVGLDMDDGEDEKMEDVTALEDGSADEEKEDKRPTFIRALCVPGLVEFAVCLFFCKMVAYTFIYWGPTYVGTIGGISPVEATSDSSFLDYGGIIGGVGAGFLADRVKSQAIVAFGCLIGGIIALYIFRTLTATLDEAHIVEYKLLMMMVGMFINAPYALITTAVSADLGTTTKGDADLMATVTGIIDGTGSIGAAIQGTLIAFVSTQYGWNSVFYLLMIFLGISALTLGRLVYRDARRLCCAKKVSDGE